MVGTIFGLILFILIVGACCCSNSGSSSNGATQKRNTYTAPRRNTGYHPNSYCECPSCGAPYYDGYCKECGYPDVNQGWLGEQY